MFVLNQSIPLFLATNLLKSDVIAMIDFSSLPHNTCALSSVTKIPLLRIHGSKDYMMKDVCDQVITMSADYTSYAHATIQILDTFQWKKIAFMFQRKPVTTLYLISIVMFRYHF